MSFSSDIPKANVKAFFALLVLLSVIGGFFMGVISVEFFTGIAGVVISHYFESQKTDIVQKQLSEATTELQQLRTDNIELLSTVPVRK